LARFGFTTFSAASAAGWPSSTVFTSFQVLASLVPVFV
jgi:hypothetical protein